MAAEFGILRDGIRPADHPLPPGTKTGSEQLKAPCGNAGSFLVGECVRDVDPERMVPTEEVMPGVNQPLLLIQNLGRRGRRDLDHTRFQVNDPRLQGDNRRPLRYAFCQLTTRAVHERKNDAYDAVVMPRTDDTAFQAVLLGLTKYVPWRAIDLSGKVPVVCDVSEALHSELHRSVMIQPGTGWKLGYYIARYTLANGLDAVRETDEVYRFLGAHDDRTRKIASYGVVRRALGVVLDSFEPTYEVARRRGAIRLPEPTAARFVSRYFNQRQPDYVPVIADALLSGPAAVVA
jgi:hypothetical protein